LYLSLSDLQENNANNTSTPDKNNTGTYLALSIGAFILGGIFVYFLARKKKK
jgi:LPXTG-motif cell wall-anchored protein